MDPQSRFGEQLHTGGTSLVWSAKQVPEDHRNTTPPLPELLGEWTALRHVYHLWNYEHNIALQTMRLWLGGPPHPQDHLDAWEREDTDWGNHPYDVALEMFRKGRDEQVAMLPAFTETAWNETRETIWGSVTLHWVIAKTVQHTMEHGSTLMKIALFWEMAVEMEQDQQK